MPRNDIAVLIANADNPGHRVIPDNIEFLTPWQVIADSGEAANRAAHLSIRPQSEVPSKHILYGLKATAVAARIDRDDVLFELEGRDTPLAVVHMTWKKETDPRWPDTRLFKNWEAWIREEMIPAHEEYCDSRK